MSVLMLRITVLALLSTTLVAGSENPFLVGTEFDFGAVPQNATLSHEVWLHAGSTETLLLEDIKTGCGCLTAPWEKTSILPNDSLRIVFYWYTRASEGMRDLSAFLYVSPEPYPLEVRLTGKPVTQPEPEASFELKPRRLDFGKARDSRAEGKVVLTNRSLGELKLSLVAAGPGIKVELADSVATGGTVEIKVMRTEVGGVAPLETSFTFEATGNPGPKERVSVPVTCGDFSFRPEFTTTRK